MILPQNDGGRASFARSAPVVLFLLPLPLMTTDEFQHFWSAVTGNMPPIAYLFKWEFQDRWFRIHSLPESKRYAETLAEWQLLLQRQHTLLKDLLGAEKRLLLLTGYYTHDEHEHATGLQDFREREDCFRKIAFRPLPAIDLHTFDSNDYESGTHYWPLLAELAPDAPQLETILRAIADDASRAFFIGEHSRVLLAPYDGGVDIILPTSQLRDQHRHKYRAWLSAREDGL